MEHQVMLLEDATPILPVHYAVRTAEGPHRIVCEPNLEYLHSLPRRPVPWQRTNDPRAVTCPLCKSTVAFQKALAQQAPIMRSKKRGTVR